MIAENLQRWASLSEEKGRRKSQYDVAMKLIAHGSLTDEQIADIVDLTVEELVALKNTPVLE